MRHRTTCRIALVTGILTLLGALDHPPVASAHVTASDSWPMYGHDAGGNRFNSGEKTLSPSSLRAGLDVQWRSTVSGGPVYGTPAVADGRVYAANIAGNVFALDEGSGQLVWLAHVGPVATFPAVVTSSVLLTATDVIVGDQSGSVWSLDRGTGAIRWVQRPNNYGYPAIWGSPSLVVARVDGRRRPVILVPVASNEETFTTTRQQPCCISRGSLAALDPLSGAVLWQTYMINDAEAAAGASGAGIWSSPVFDGPSNLIYVSTGNNYGNHPGIPSTDTSDAIIAIDASDGHIAWKNQRNPNDTFATAYPVSPAHPDADFGDSPKLIDGGGHKTVVAGQKSGFVHALDATTGQALMQHQFLPGGGLGGFFADSAEHDGVVYGNGNDWPGYGGGETGGLLALIAGQIKPSRPPNAGEVVAVRVDRSTRSLREVWRFTTPHSPMLGAVAAANGVIYVHSSKEGVLYAIDARKGRVLARAAVGPAVNGPSVAGGHVFLGFGDTFGFAAADPTTGGVMALGLGPGK